MNGRDNSIDNEKEGVIKFHLDFEKTEIITPDQTKTLDLWREKLFALNLIGQDPNRYQGLGYGNLSHRLSSGSQEFIITGSQTSHLPKLTCGHYSLVVDSDIEHNRLLARGLTEPSSEALTHSAFYAASENINFVFHVHSPLIWNNARKLGIPVTSAAVTYGTPEMAREIKKLFESGQLGENAILAMGGHPDGVIAFGATANDAGNNILRELEKLKV